MKYNTKPLTKKDFAWTNWNISEMKKQAQTALHAKVATHEQIKNVPTSEQTFENTVYALEKINAELADVMSKIDLHSQISNKKSNRSAALNIVTELEQQLVDIDHDADLYVVFAAYAKQKKNKHRAHEKLLIDDYMRGFKRMGFDLPKSDQNKLKKLTKQMRKLGSEFQFAINNYEDHIVVTKKQLQGLPEAYKTSLSPGSKQGTYKIGLSYPESIPFMQYAQSEAKRKELTKKLARKGGKKNVTRISKIISLRQERAVLLGYKHHADFVTETRMAGSASNVESFLTSLVPDISKGAKQDISLLNKAKKTDGGKSPLALHDLAYYINKTQKETYNIDSQELKQYFPLNHVKQEMLNLYSYLFGIEFKKKNISLWHQDAELYEVIVDGAVRGYIAMDLYPRSGKYGHAAVFPLTSGRKKTYSKQDAEYIPAVCALVCNFSKPTKKQPSLLSLREVETLFHECGHAIHHTVSQVEFPSQSGTSVDWDFVETPSQILENWVYEADVLQKISSHHQTAQPLEHKTIEKIQAARNYMDRYATARQLVFGLTDLTIHTKQVTDIQKLYCSLSKKLYGLTPDPDAYFIAGFGHMIGYDAGYYGYLWSLVFADDMYSQFKKHGVLSKRLGKKLRKEIFQVGSSRKEIDSVKAFLGRKPNNKAFLKKLGV